MDFIRAAQVVVAEFLQQTPAGVVALVGPTASGKTALGIALAQLFNGEILSADSRQIYRYMDIGTAKPTAAEQAAVPHHLIDIIDPDQSYTVAEYKMAAESIIDRLLAQGKCPFLVGGTGLYVDAVCLNYAIPPVPPQATLRVELEQQYATAGATAMHAWLEELDPAAAAIIKPEASRHLLRALEICLSTGQTKSALAVKHPPRYPVLYLGLDWPRATLYQRINARTAQMWSAGLVAETQQLLARGYAPTCPAMTGIGYAEAYAYGQGVLSESAAIAEIQKRTRHYAKRQMTWFRRLPQMHWLPG